MGLFSKRNLDKAKALAEKNAGKIAQGVDKATDAVNKKTKGKYADKLRKVDAAASKFARQTTGSTTGATETGATGTDPSSDDTETPSDPA